MKRPKKNKWMDRGLPAKSQEGQDEEEEDEENEGVRRVRAGLKVKRDRRQGSSSATLCQVCNIQLNSSAQAQIHYRGKTHQRKLRRLAKAVSTGRTGLFYYVVLFASTYKFTYMLTALWHRPMMFCSWLVSLLHLILISKGNRFHHSLTVCSMNF